MPRAIRLPPVQYRGRRRGVSPGPHSWYASPGYAGGGAASPPLSWPGYTPPGMPTSSLLGYPVRISPYAYPYSILRQGGRRVQLAGLGESGVVGDLIATGVTLNWWKVIVSLVANFAAVFFVIEVLPAYTEKRVGQITDPAEKRRAQVKTSAIAAGAVTAINNIILPLLTTEKTEG